MIVVPDKTIAYYSIANSGNVSIDQIIKPLNINHKRDWFTSNFYMCLPLSIANMQGFSFSVPYDFEVYWNGKNSVYDLKINIDEENEITEEIKIQSTFGNGIFTVNFPFVLITPPGINLMTISPPNFPTPGLSPMSGVVESDNLNYLFTINVKVDIPNISIKIKKDVPISAILPIPRYFCDNFNLLPAQKLLKEEDFLIVKQSATKQELRRNEQVINNLGADGLYYRGYSIDNNKFKDHQLPRKKK